ncbi:hypothetical protein [Pareuzebyella sediminis]|uniref:hypothetical protein n=1 Tax=Pareuzebyella sediminis TaxID=2607998 RepID=UPI0011ED4957|nr:hypothetical protein [Pareuzebyella sediminis]
MKKKIGLNNLLVIFIVIWFLQSCDSDSDAGTRIESIGGGLLPERQVEVPYDFPEAEPLGTGKHEKVLKTDN